MENVQLIQIIYKQIQKDLDNKYTEYKNKCLQDLNLELESKRNEIIKSALDGIDIEMQENPYQLSPILHIVVEKKLKG